MRVAAEPLRRARGLPSPPPPSRRPSPRAFCSPPRAFVGAVVRLDHDGGLPPRHPLFVSSRVFSSFGFRVPRRAGLARAAAASADSASGVETGLDPSPPFGCRVEARRNLRGLTRVVVLAYPTRTRGLRREGPFPRKEKKQARRCRSRRRFRRGRRRRRLRRDRRRRRRERRRVQRRRRGLEGDPWGRGRRRGWRGVPGDVSPGTPVAAAAKRPVR